MLADGRACVLRSTLPFFTAPAWTTCATGLAPGHHGMYHWRGRYDPEAGERALLSSQHLDTATIWSHAQTHGARVSVSNFPMQYPAPVTQGRYLCGTLAPEGAADASWPPGLVDEVRELVPDYRFEMNKGISYLDRPAELRDHVLDVGRGHALAFERLMGAGDADLTFHVATVTDRAHHFFWHHIDEAHPLHAEAPVAELGDPIADAYGIAESSLAMALDAAGWDAVVLVSDHGAGRSTLAFWGDAWLVQEGFAVPSEEGRVDMEASVAYCGEEPECAIYVSRRSRDGAGASDAEHPHVVEALRARLLALRRPDGLPAFDAVHSAGELYDGDLAHLGPDLVLVPSDGVHPRPGASEEVFTPATRLYSGHRRDGLLVAAGAGIAPGNEREPLDMADVFPLLCALLELPLPGGLAGRVPAWAPQPARALDRDWRTRVAGPPQPQPRDAGLLDRLAELGYT